MVDEFSVTLEVVDLIVPEGLYSVKFESHSHVPGVSLCLDLAESIRESTTYLPIGSLPHIGECPALVYVGGGFQ